MECICIPGNQGGKDQILTFCVLHDEAIQLRAKALLKEERRRIQKAIQALPNAREVEQAVFTPPKAPEATL